VTFCASGRPAVTQGAKLRFSKAKNWCVYTVTDGQPITGRNTAWSGPAAKLLIDRLNKKAK
jgi:hypothetical protein